MDPGELRRLGRVNPYTVIPSLQATLCRVLTLRNPIPDVDELTEEEATSLCSLSLVNNYDDSCHQPGSYYYSPSGRGKETKGSLVLLFKYKDRIDVLLTTTAVFSSLCLGSLPGIMLLIMKNIFSSWGTHDASKFWVCVKTAAGLSIGALVFGFLSTTCTEISAERRTARIKKECLKAVFQQEMSFYASSQIRLDDFACRLNRSLEIARSGCGSNFCQLFNYISQILVTYIVALVSGWRMTLILSAALPCLAAGICFAMVGVRKKVADARLDYIQKSDKIIWETVSQIRSVMLLCAEQWSVKSFKKSISSSSPRNMKAVFLGSMGVALMSFGVLFALCVAWRYGSRIIALDAASDILSDAGANVMTVLLGLICVCFSCGKCLTVCSKLSNASSGIATVFSLIDRKPRVRHRYFRDLKTDAKMNSNRKCQQNKMKTKTLDDEIQEHKKTVRKISPELNLYRGPVLGAVVFDDVDFTDYHSKKEKEILCNFSLRVSANESVGILLVPSSNNSQPIFNNSHTNQCWNDFVLLVINLLLLLEHPDDGSIRIDGVDVHNWDPIYLRSAVSVISSSSDNKIHGSSILENLLTPSAHCTDYYDQFVDSSPSSLNHNKLTSVVVDVCKRTGIHDEVMQLSNGYQSDVSELPDTDFNRFALSAARALLRDTKIYIIDVPWISCPATQNRLLQLLCEWLSPRHDKTIILFASKLEHLPNVDSVFHANVHPGSVALSREVRVSDCGDAASLLAETMILTDRMKRQDSSRSYYDTPLAELHHCQSRQTKFFEESPNGNFSSVSFDKMSEGIFSSRENLGSSDMSLALTASPEKWRLTPRSPKHLIKNKNHHVEESHNNLFENSDHLDNLYDNYFRRRREETRDDDKKIDLKKSISVRMKIKKQLKHISSSLRSDFLFINFKNCGPVKMGRSEMASSVVGILMSMVIGAAYPIVGILLGQFIRSVLDPKHAVMPTIHPLSSTPYKKLAVTNGLTIVFFVFAGLVAIVVFLQQLTLGIVGERMVAKLRVSVFSAAICLPLASFDQQAILTPKNLSRICTLSSRVKVIAHLNAAATAYECLAGVVICLVFSFYRDPKLAGVTLSLFSIPVIFLCLRNTLAARIKSFNRYSSILLNRYIASVRQLGLLNLASRSQALYSQALQEEFVQHRKLSVYYGVFNGLSYATVFGATGGSLYAAGTFARDKLEDNNVAFSRIAEILVYSIMCGISITQTYNWRPCTSIRKSADDEIESILKMIPADINIRGSILQIQEKKNMQTESLRLELRDVTFSYDPRADLPFKKFPYLNSLSLSVKPNEIVGLVGLSDGGATALIDIITGLYSLEPAGQINSDRSQVSVLNKKISLSRRDTAECDDYEMESEKRSVCINSGTIFLDDTDITTINSRSLRLAVGIVKSNPPVFSTTITENILLGNPLIDENHKNCPRAVSRVAEMANIHDLISKLEFGYSELLAMDSAGRNNLSLSQLQRLDEARAIINEENMKLIIVDDSCSTCRFEQHRTRNALIEFLTGCKQSVIIISTDVELLKICDRVLWFPQPLGGDDENGVSNVSNAFSSVSSVASVVQSNISHEHRLEVLSRYVDSTHNELMKTGGGYRSLIYREAKVQRQQPSSKLHSLLWEPNS